MFWNSCFLLNRGECVLKWYKYLFFCCLVFFCCCGDVLGITIKGENYPKDCAGNVITRVDNSKGSNNNNNNSNSLCSIDLNSKNQINVVNGEKDNPNTCTIKEPDIEEKSRSILLLIDNSYSMNEDWKKKEVRRVFREIARQMEDNDKIYIKYFRNHENCGADECGGNPLSKSELNTPQKIKNVSKKILVYSGDNKPCKNSLCYGTATYSAEALTKASNFVQRKVKKTVPVVIFITDGYPTAYKSNRGENFELGYLSSARHYYKFAVAMKELKEQFDNLKTGKNANTYIKNGIYTPKFVTVGLDVDGDSDLSVKYLLSTTKEARENIKTTAFNGRTVVPRYREDAKFYNLLNRSENSDPKYEITFSIASNPDLGVVGASPSDEAKSVKFEDLSNISNKDKAEKAGFAFGPIKKGVAKSVTYSEKVGESWKEKTLTITKGMRRELSDGYKRYEIIVIDYRKGIWQTIRSNKKIKINLNKKVSESLMSYNLGKDNIGSSLDGFVAKSYLSKNNGDISLNDIQEILKIDKEKEDTTPSKISYKKVIHNGLSSDKKTISLGEGYVRHCDSLKNNDQECEIKHVKVQAVYMVDASINFDSGTLKNNGTAYSPGLGFEFQNLKTTVSQIWYFTGYADENKKVPIVEYQASDSNNWYKINFDSVYKDDKLSAKFITREKLWQTINDKVLEDIKNNKSVLNINYKTVDSNSSEGNLISIDKKIDSDFSGVTTTIDSDGDTLYNLTKIDKIKKSCIKGENFEYVDDACSIGYTATDEYAGENFSYIKEGERYYFIPFGYKQKNVDVNIGININGASLSTTCSISVDPTGKPCSPNEEDSEPRSVEEQVSYRSIDVSNPFPRASRQYYRIPINWRNWYCTGVGTSNGCVENKNNINRLKGSYANIYYSGDYDSDKLTSIAKDTLNSSNNYYSSWENIDVETGKSKALDDNFIKQQFSNSAPSYCPLGSFDKKCDIYK